MRKTLSVLLLLLLSLPASGADVNVFAAASLTDALTEIARAYEKTCGDRIVFNFAGSGILARQIEEGAPADLFASADDERMNGLEAKGLLDKATRTSFLSNTLVIVLPREGGLPFRRPADLARFERVAIADPKIVPAGNYAMRYLERAGLARAVAPRIIPTENVRAALATVVAGNAGAAFVFKTDALSSKDVRIAYECPASEVPAIAYPFAVMKEAGHPAAAKKFLAHLQTKAALDVFRKHGFLVTSR